MGIKRFNPDYQLLKQPRIDQRLLIECRRKMEMQNIAVRKSAGKLAYTQCVVKCLEMAYSTVSQGNVILKPLMACDAKVNIVHVVVSRKQYNACCEHLEIPKSRPSELFKAVINLYLMSII